MDHRSLEINVASAKDLKDVNLISKMDVYVIVEIAGDPYNHKQKTKTKVDHDGGKNPAWNFPMKFTVLESALQDNRLSLAFKLRCDRVLGDVDIGEVVVPIKELLDSAADCKSGMKLVTYQVRKPSGKGKGELTFSYKFGDVVKGQEALPPPPPVFTAYSAQSAPSPSYQTVASTPPPPAGYPAAPPPPAGYPAAAPPPAGYPAAPPPPSGYPAAPPPAGYPAAAPPPAGYPYPPPAVAAGYPQAPAGYAYPPAYGSYPPPPAGYGYPPPAAGYGYPAYPPPPAGYGYQQQPQKNNLGMGLGAGLLGGAVGGLLIGEMLSDAGSYDAGYDAGFDDGFGF